MNSLEHLLENPDDYMLQAGGEYELISEMSFLRSYMKYKGCRIFIYGAGMRGEYIYRWLKKENIPVDFVIDRDCKKIGGGQQSPWKDVNIYDCDNIPVLEDKKYLAVISTNKFQEEQDAILSVLYDHKIYDYIYPFDAKYCMAPYRIEWAHYYLMNKEKIISQYNSLKDEISKDVYFEYIKAILSNCVYRGKQEISCKKYFECYSARQDEVFLNVGSFVGDTIFYFIENRDEKFEKIYALEGSSSIYRDRLQKNLNILPEHIRNRIETECMFLNGVNAKEFNNKKITLINMDIEGSEKEALEGLMNCIIKNRPVLAVCAYHKPEDIIELPQLVSENLERYSVIFRKYAAPYSNHLENGELVMYAVPEERMVQEVR